MKARVIGMATMRDGNSFHVVEVLRSSIAGWVVLSTCGVRVTVLRCCGDEFVLMLGNDNA